MDALNSEHISKIRHIIAQYKEFMPTEQGKEELYKWRALAHFRKHWDIDAANFSAMLEESLRETENLLASGTYFPLRMILQFAEANPEGVRNAFRHLYETELTISERYHEFCEQCQIFTDDMVREDGKPRKHFQDPRAVMWYLALRFPERYFPYKHSVYQNAIQLIGYQAPQAKRRTPIWKAECSQMFCELFLEQVKQDQELIQLHKERLPELWEQDSRFHLLVFDILFFAEKYMGKFEEAKDYWPSLDVYDPEITVEQWREILQDSSVTYPDSLMMLTLMLQEGGESTCAHLAEKYGRTSDFYNLNGRMFAERVKRKLDCPDCMGDDGIERVFTVAFLGKPTNENNMRRYIWRLRRELKEALESMELKSYSLVESEPLQKFSRNMILYGPPGTGKTYHTLLYAVAILEGKSVEAVEQEDYQTVRQRYQAYKEDKRIEFVTFHQSYGYEDFIEGIRPVVPQNEGDDGGSADMIYKVLPGVFKSFCKEAQKPVTLDRPEYSLNENPAIWKVSLEGTGDNATRAECLQNGHIRIGWDGYGEDLSEQTEYQNGGARILNTFYNRMRVGDLVFSCYSATEIDAIGVITGGPEWDDSYPSYKRLRKVKWLAKGIKADIQAINDGHAMVQGTVYQLWNVSLESAYQLIETYGEAREQRKKPPYVMIIDEINRGNISKIFGELITLVEDNKRIGGKEETRVKLPYSQELFGVPENLYIIGTMNTADRSIMALDTALRRRFDFVEMLPEPDIFEDVMIGPGSDAISVANLLNTMNRRIEALYDREHTIGHAYFMPLREDRTLDRLGAIFTEQVIPLLQEYFFDDYEKIRLVLGDNQKQSGDGTEFVIAQRDDYQQLFGNYDMQQEEKLRYQIDRQAAKRMEAYRFLR